MRGWAAAPWLLCVTLVGVRPACLDGAEGGPLPAGKASAESGAASQARARRDVRVVRQCDLGAPSAKGGDLRIARDLAYGHVHGEPLHIDLFAPSGPGPFPLVVLFHGGAWTRGDEDWMTGLAERLAAEGWAAATVEYRLVDASAHRWPGPIADARCAVRWLRAHAETHRLDPDRIAAMGGSAGGHLAALLATAADDPSLDGGECSLTAHSAEVAGAVAFYAPHDLRASAQWSDPADGVITKLLGGSRHEHADRAAAASPVAQIDGRDAPLLLVHGTADRVVEPAQSRRMRDAARRQGVPVALVEVEGGRHGFHLIGGDPSHRAAGCSTLAFLRQVLEEG